MPRLRRAARASARSRTKESTLRRPSHAQHDAARRRFPAAPPPNWRPGHARAGSRRSRSTPLRVRDRAGNGTTTTATAATAIAATATTTTAATVTNATAATGTATAATAATGATTATTADTGTATVTATGTNFSAWHRCNDTLEVVKVSPAVQTAVQGLLRDWAA